VVEFQSCEMDGFVVSKNSDLSNITLTNPIFSSVEEAERVASLFPAIPSFMTEPIHRPAFTLLIKQGKHISLSGMGKFVINLIISNELELFSECLQCAIKEPLNREIVALFKEAAVLLNRTAFIEVIEINHAVLVDTSCPIIDTDNGILKQVVSEKDQVARSTDGGEGGSRRVSLAGPNTLFGGKDVSKDVIGLATAKSFSNNIEFT
jgi:hypothetical protein